MKQFSSGHIVEGILLFVFILQCICVIMFEDSMVNICQLPTSWYQLLDNFFRLLLLITIIAEIYLILGSRLFIFPGETLVAFSPPGDLPNPGVEPMSLTSPEFAGRSLPLAPPLVLVFPDFCPWGHVDINSLQKWW